MGYARLIDAALPAEVGQRLRSVKRAFEPAHVSRDRRDNEHLRAILAAVLPADAHCVDVGAHRGAVLADLVRLAPEGRHIAYEPLPDLAAELRARFPGVDVREAALSNAAGSVPFVHVVSNPGWSGLRQRPYPRDEEVRAIEVATERLDDTLPAGFAPSFIKIDVEGAEGQVLEGALRTIEAHRPLIALEHGRGSAEYYGTRPQDVFDLLVSRCGLRIFDLDGGGPYPAEDFVHAFERAERVNYLVRR